MNMILTEALRLYCTKNKIGPRALAREIGLIPMTASRFLRGESVSSEQFAKILIWSMQVRK